MKQYTDGRRTCSDPNILLNGKWYYNCKDEKLILKAGWRVVKIPLWKRILDALLGVE